MAGSSACGGIAPRSQSMTKFTPQIVNDTSLAGKGLRPRDAEVERSRRVVGRARRRGRVWRGTRRACQPEADNCEYLERESV